MGGIGIVQDGVDGVLELRRLASDRWRYTGDEMRTGAYKFGDEARAALERQLVDLGLVLFLVFRSRLFRHFRVLEGDGIGLRAFGALEYEMQRQWGVCRVSWC